MRWYRIEANGTFMGTFEGDSEEEALDRYAKDAGYTNFADRQTVAPCHDMFVEMATDEIKQVLDGVDVTINGKEVNDYTTVFVAVSHVLVGGEEFEDDAVKFSRVSKERAARIWEEHKPLIDQMWDRGCDGKIFEL